jgi:excisionase family DNA binding protein
VSSGKIAKSPIDRHRKEENMTDGQGPRPLLVTIKEAAKILAVSERTVYRLIKQGKLTTVKVTEDTPRIRYDQLEALVTQASDPSEG